MVLACTSGQTGGQVRTPAEDAAESGCVDVTRTPVEREAATPLGFPADSILAFTEGSHTETIQWGPGARHADALRVTPADGTGQLMLTIEATGPIEVREQTPSSSDGGEELAPAACPDLLTIGVRVQITTDDGGLDEVFDAELRTTSGTEASLHLPLIPARLRGSFAVEVLQPHQTIEQVRLSTTFSPEGFRGSITGTLATSQGKNGSAESVTFGRWPAGEPLDEE